MSDPRPSDRRTSTSITQSLKAQIADCAAGVRIGGQDGNRLPVLLAWQPAHEEVIDEKDHHLRREYQ